MNYVVKMADSDVEFVLQNKQFFEKFIPVCNEFCDDNTFDLLCAPVYPELFKLPDDKPKIMAAMKNTPPKKRLRYGEIADTKSQQPSITRWFFPAEPVCDHATTDKNVNESEGSSYLALSD